MPRTPALRTLPSVDALLRHPALAGALESLPRPLVVESVRAEIGHAREGLRRSKGRSLLPEPGELAARALVRAHAEHRDRKSVV